MKAKKCNKAKANQELLDSAKNLLSAIDKHMDWKTWGEMSDDDVIGLQKAIDRLQKAVKNTP